MNDTIRYVTLWISVGIYGEYTDVVNHQLSSGMVESKELWFRSSLVLPNEVGYFKRETTLYLETLRKDGRISLQHSLLCGTRSVCAYPFTGRNRYRKVISSSLAGPTCVTVHFCYPLRQIMSTSRYINRLKALLLILNFTQTVCSKH